MDYEIGAVLEKNATLYLVITNYSAYSNTVWYYSTPTGWAITDYTNTKQKFIASQTGKIGAIFQFQAPVPPGSCRIDFYENGDVITKTRYFKWQ